MPYQPEYPVLVFAESTALVLGVGKASGHSSWLTLETVPYNEIDFGLLNSSAFSGEDACPRVETSIPLTDLVVEELEVVLIAGSDSGYTLERFDPVREPRGSTPESYFYWLVLVNADVRASGECVYGSQTWDYDLDLRRGWNWTRHHASLLDDGVLITVDATAPRDDTPWVVLGDAIAAGEARGQDRASRLVLFE